MNWVEARGRKEEVNHKLDDRNIASKSKGVRLQRDLYRDLLLECVTFLPEVNPHGIDRRAIEEALRGDRSKQPSLSELIDG